MECSEFRAFFLAFSQSPTIPPTEDRGLWLRDWSSELNIWNDNIQSFRPETSEALFLVFHAVRTSVSVPRMQTVRGPYVSFSPLLGPLHGQYKFENK